MLNWRLYFGLFLIGCSATTQAASVTIGVAATVYAVPCTTEQRARIRACVVPEQHLSIGPYKTVVTTESRTGQQDGFGPRHEILADPSRQMMVKTILY